MKGLISRRAVCRGLEAGAAAGLFGSAWARAAQDEQFPDNRKLKLPREDDDPRLPDGKSQKMAIAKEQHAQALKDAEELVDTAEQLRDELKKAGSYTVPLTSVKRTEEIEKLAKRIRGRLRS